MFSLSVKWPPGSGLRKIGDGGFRNSLRVELLGGNGIGIMERQDLQTARKRRISLGVSKRLVMLSSMSFRRLGHFESLEVLLTVLLLLLLPSEEEEDDEQYQGFGTSSMSSIFSMCD